MSKIIIIEQINDKQVALGGDTYNIREKIKKSWGGEWSSITRKWIMPEGFKKEFLDADGIKYEFNQNPKEQVIIQEKQKRRDPQEIAEDELIRLAIAQVKNNVEIQYRPLHSANCYKYREQIKAGGGKWDSAQRLWYVPLNFDDSFLHESSTKPERKCSVCNGEGHDARTCTACKICKGRDHFAKDCKCIHCGTSQMYHFSHRCPTLNKKFKFMEGCSCSLEMGVCPLCEHACCKKAHVEPCACKICIICDEHGRHCYGSHD
jgi:hypothetical protein